MKTLRCVGLDVHKESIAIAVAEPEGGEPSLVGTIPNDTRLLLQKLKCIVVAPSLVPKQVGSRVKTDRRDAVKLARFLRSGDLTAVAVPDQATEAMRDLERARDDAKNVKRSARHQLGKFLLRHGRIYQGKTAWSRGHFDWIRKQAFKHEAQQRVLTDYLRTVEQAAERVAQLTRDMEELVKSWSLAPLVKALQALRGVQLVTAVVIAAELGDLSRFKSAPQLIAYLGLVPSEHSSGDSKQRGRITRTGNSHVRRALVEAAWAYRFRASMSAAIRERNEGLPRPVRDIAWKAQERLHRRYCEDERPQRVQAEDRHGNCARADWICLGHRSSATEARRLRERRAAQPADERRADKGESSPSL